MADAARIGVANHGKSDLTVYVEPWAETFVLPPGQSREIHARGKNKMPWFNVVYGDNSIQVYVEDAETFVVRVS